jgi:hypothetical protein
MCFLSWLHFQPSILSQAFNEAIFLNLSALAMVLRVLLPKHTSQIVNSYKRPRLRSFIQAISFWVMFVFPLTRKDYRNSLYNIATNVRSQWHYMALHGAPTYFLLWSGRGYLTDLTYLEAARILLIFKNQNSTVFGRKYCSLKPGTVQRK